MANSDVLFKVIALYLLNRAGGSLSNAHICEFFVSKNYTDYFSTLSVIGDLGNSGLIDTDETHNTTVYTINESGMETLSALKDKLSTTTKEEVEEYLKANEISLKETKELKSYYDKASMGGFVVTLKLLEENVTLLDVNLHVGSEIQAKSICTNWKNNYEKVYESLMDLV